MSYNSRNGATGAQGTHWENPLLVGGGPLDDAPRGAVDNALSPYKIYYEDFREVFVDNQIETKGWQNDAIGAATGESVTSTGAGLGMLLNPGTAADEGMQIQFKIAPTAAALGDGHNILPQFTSTATLMDNREIFFQTRLGHVSATAATSNNKWLVGFFTDDDSLLNATSGLPTVAAGGGFGFHKGEGGAVTGVSTEAAIVAAGTAMSPAVSHLALTADATIEWHTYAARCRVIDADAGTGFTDFWVDNVHRLRLSTVPFDSTEIYSFAIAIANGPAAVVVSDMWVDYILTGITRPGLTWPYTNGVIY